MDTISPHRNVHYSTGQTVAGNFKGLACETHMGDETRLNQEKTYYTYPKLSKHSEEQLKELTKNLSDLNYLGITAVPYELILKVIEFLPYGHVVRVMVMFLFLTGCRLSELPRMRFSGDCSYVKGCYVFWRPGKRQDHLWRREYLPPWYLRELMYYRQNNPIMDDHLFGIDWTTLRRYFNRDVRPHLGRDWNLLTMTPRRNWKDYQFQLKGIRKSFATLLFFNEANDNWNGDYDVALQFISKRMCHSSVQMTAHHYLNSFELLKMDKWKGMTPAQILSMATQRHLVDYDEQLKLETNQSRMQEWF